jgi:glutamine amidotransferase
MTNAGENTRDSSGRQWRLKTPHIGWDSVQIVHSVDLLGLANLQTLYFYFNHSFAVYPNNRKDIVAISNGGYGPFCSIINKENIYGCQFHPELSGQNGLRLLRNFVGKT